jgi:hypothetical protein
MWVWEGAGWTGGHCLEVTSWEVLIVPGVYLPDGNKETGRGSAPL